MGFQFMLSQSVLCISGHAEYQRQPAYGTASLIVTPHALCQHSTLSTLAAAAGALLTDQSNRTMPSLALGAILRAPF